ncbi:MAG: hypothetical protein ACFFD2_28990, partial [Promethearchaeota archaeon]
NNRNPKIAKTPILKRKCSRCGKIFNLVNYKHNYCGKCARIIKIIRECTLNGLVQEVYLELRDLVQHS